MLAECASKCDADSGTDLLISINQSSFRSLHLNEKSNVSSLLLVGGKIMKVLVAFGTTEGHTQKIAKHVAAKIQEKGHEVDLYDCSRRLRGHEFGAIDAVIVASSVHQKNHQETVVAFATAHREGLNAKPSALISVSLSAAFEDGKKDAADYVERFINVTGWQPKFVHMAGGALKYSEYDFFKEQIIRYIVMAGRDIPSDQNDWEFTDWAALDNFVMEFLENASSRVMNPATE